MSDRPLCFLLIYMSSKVYYLGFTHFFKYCNIWIPGTPFYFTTQLLPLSRQTFDGNRCPRRRKINICSFFGLIKVLICFSNSIPMAFCLVHSVIAYFTFVLFILKFFYIYNKHCSKYNFTHVHTYYDMRTYTYGDHSNS